jgi:hypothetical protein
LDSSEGFLERKAKVLHHVCQDKSNGPRNSSHAVNKDVSEFARFVDEIDSSIEMDAEVVVLVVLSRYIQRVRNMLFRMPYVHIFACCQYRSNIQL